VGGGHSVNSTAGQGEDLNMEEDEKNEHLNGAGDDIENVVNNHPRTTCVVSPPDEFHPFFGQNLNLGLAEIAAPKSPEIRQMLLELRKLLGWSRGFAASVIGVTESSIEKWEKGRRRPTGAARKFIWFLHSHFIRKDDKIRNAWDLATWGQIPCRGSFAKLRKFVPTLYVKEEIFQELAKAHNLASKTGPRVLLAELPPECW